MKSILEAIYYGNLRPEENIVSKDPEYRSVNKEITAYIENFQRALSKDDFKKLEELFDMMYQIHSINSCEAFVEGLKIGTLIMNETFQQK